VAQREQSRPQFEFRRAERDDLGLVVDILTEAATWARDRGIQGLWWVPFPPERIAPALERGDVYLVLDGPAAIGTITLQWSDVDFWGERPPDAGYIHRLAIRRSVAGHGVGPAMLRWADQRAREAGRRYLRLDCRSTHAALRRYYLNAGFAIIGAAVVHDVEVVLLERAIGLERP
jgi:protein-tyrosine phosphatase